MHLSWCSRPRPKPLLTAILLAVTAATTAGLALAQSLEEQRAEPYERLASPRVADARRGASAGPLRIGAVGDSIWVGHSIQTIVPGTPSTYSYGPFHVGRGDNRPGLATGVVGNSGVWTWDHFKAESDSLQGWWPIRRAYSIAVAQTASDVDRPWWAVDIGNQGNYVLTSANGRTRGVISYWHVDGGSSATQIEIPGTNALPMTWAPLNGTGSAWCGLRAHGDITYSDPLTGNAYNASVLEFNGETGGGTAGGGIGTNKKFPGYPSQMDQLLYTDVEILTSSATLNLSFSYRTAMSTQTTTTLLTRTGWFQFDPTRVGNVSVAGPNNGMPNYISNSGIGQPADSFMVYLGVPVDNSAAYLADGTNPPVYDLKRRWLSEVIALDKPIKEKLHVAGNTNTTFTLTGEALADFYDAQPSSPNKYLRVVLRAKSNRGFDDMNGSIVGQFSSGGKGMVMVDDVVIGGTGLANGAFGTTTFDSPGAVDNGVATDALVLGGAWRATGKPPAVFFHTHPLSGGSVDSPTNSNLYAPLTFQDICGPPMAAARFCNMRGVVISMGDHDQTGEPAGGVVSGTPERERMDGMVSPTIILANAGNGAYNGMGIDLAAATTLDDYYVVFDIYTGIFNLFFTGNAYTFGFQSYPGRQNDNVLCWGDIRYPNFQVSQPDIRCYQEVQAAKGHGLIRTALPGSRPDSIRIFLGKNQQCFRFAVTGAGCSSTGGAYWDNVSLLLSDASGSVAPPSASIQVDIAQWINDTFPVNDGLLPSPPGYAVAPGTAGFDTAAAHIKTGVNIAQSPGDHFRFDIPGDSVVVVADVVESVSGLGRVDMVFRIKPGVGNYHTIGDPNSGLRPVPTDPVNIVTSGDASFWGQYMTDPGYMSKGVHGPGNFWNKNVWNSARMDTADVNIWPVPSNSGVFDVSVNFTNDLLHMGCYHEGNDGAPDDASQSAKFNILGISHAICFLDPNPLGAVNSTNIKCPGTYSGTNIAVNYANPPLFTKEGTKIIPDGLLTPGAHVEYFIRAQEELTRNDAAFVMAPETTFVSPQRNEGPSTDGHRWQQFGVLPDRWKDISFNSGMTPGESGALGMACMLYVDWADRRGVERTWVSIADSTGLTASSRRGNHNGWRARSDQSYTTPAGEPIDISGDPTIARYDHGGQPGSTWDMFGVKGAEMMTSVAGSLGSRMGQQADGLATGKDSKQGPTLAMLSYYYKVLLILTGDVNAGIFGRFTNRGADDVKLLRQYLQGASSSSKRALIIGGDGFVQSEYAAGVGPEPDHLSLLTDYLGVTIRQDPPGGNPQYSYQPLSGNYASYVDLTSAGPMGSNVYSLGNDCLWGNDVLTPVANGLGTQVSGYYQGVGTKGPYVAGVYTPMASGKHYLSMVDGWDARHLFSLGALEDKGRLWYYTRLITLLAAQNGLWSCIGGSTFFLDVSGDPSFIDFLSLRNTPTVTGRPIVHFGLARADRVTARIYDVAGRRVRTLADRNFPAGEHDLTWDGANDRGGRMERGVYFVQLAYARSGFKDAKKLIVLR